MPVNRGKDFENKFKEDFQKIPNSHVERIYDNVSGYKSIRGRSDFITYLYPNQYFIECKAHYGNTFPWSEYRQYDDMLEVAGIPGIRSGVVLWMIDHSLVVYLPVKTVEAMKQDGRKSFHIKDTDDGKYRIFSIPSIQKRVFMDSDYSVLKTLLRDGD